MKPSQHDLYTKNTALKYFRPNPMVNSDHVQRLCFRKPNALTYDVAYAGVAQTVYAQSFDETLGVSKSDWLSHIQPRRLSLVSGGGKDRWMLCVGDKDSKRPLDPTVMSRIATQVVAELDVENILRTAVSRAQPDIDRSTAYWKAKIGFPMSLNASNASQFFGCSAWDAVHDLVDDVALLAGKPAMYYRNSEKPSAVTVTSDEFAAELADYMMTLNPLQQVQIFEFGFVDRVNPNYADQIVMEIVVVPLPIGCQSSYPGLSSYEVRHTRVLLPEGRLGSGNTSLDKPLTDRALQEIADNLNKIKSTCAVAPGWQARGPVAASSVAPNLDNHLNKLKREALISLGYDPTGVGEGESVRTFAHVNGDDYHCVSIPLGLVHGFDHESDAILFSIPKGTPPVSDDFVASPTADTALQLRRTAWLETNFVTRLFSGPTAGRLVGMGHSEVPGAESAARDLATGPWWFVRNGTPWRASLPYDQLMLAQRVKQTGGDDQDLTVEVPRDSGDDELITFRTLVEKALTKNAIALMVGPIDSVGGELGSLGAVRDERGGPIRYDWVTVAAEGVAVDTLREKPSLEDVAIALARGARLVLWHSPHVVTRDEVFADVGAVEGESAFKSLVANADAQLLIDEAIISSIGTYEVLSADAFTRIGAMQHAVDRSGFARLLGPSAVSFLGSVTKPKELRKFEAHEISEMREAGSISN